MIISDFCKKNVPLQKKKRFKKTDFLEIDLFEGCFGWEKHKKLKIQRTLEK